MFFSGPVTGIQVLPGNAPRKVVPKAAPKRAAPKKAAAKKVAPKKKGLFGK